MLTCNPSPSSNQSARGLKTGLIPGLHCTVKTTDRYSPQPLNRALKKLGVMILLACETAFHSYGTHASECQTWPAMRWLIVSGLLAFTRILGMDPKEAEQLCLDAVAATKNKSIHSYYPQ
jgi:hypothetical protein